MNGGTVAFRGPLRGHLRVTENLFLLFLKIRLDRSGELDGQRIAMAILGLAHLDPDPAFADVGFLGALEAYADIALERLVVIIRTARVIGETVGRLIGFGGHDTNNPVRIACATPSQSVGAIFASLPSCTMAATSSAKNLPNCSGVIVMGSAPSCCNLSLIAGMLSAVLISRLSLATIIGEIPAGAETPPQNRYSAFG